MVQTRSHNERPYPENIFSDILGWDQDAELLPEITPDQTRGLEYILGILPNYKQEVVRLFYKEQWPRLVIAEHLGKNTADISSALIEAQDKLRTPGCYAFLTDGYTDAIQKFCIEENVWSNKSTFKVVAARQWTRETTLEEAPLFASRNAQKRFHDARIHTIGDILKKGPQAVESIRMFGAAQRELLETVLERHGFSQYDNGVPFHLTYQEIVCYRRRTA